MKRCPFCAEEIQDNAIVCRFCGKNLPVAVPPAASSNERPVPEWVAQLPPPRFSGRAVAVAVVLVLVLVTIVVVTNVQPETTSTVPGSPHSAGAAFGICKQFVTDRLRAPKTAEFGRFSDATIRGGADGEYDVSAYVDAQNGFGALLRQDFVCTVRHVSGTSWRLVDLKMTQR